MAKRGCLSLLAMGGAGVIVICALIAGYMIRHAGAEVTLRPYSGYPNEPGDSVYIVSGRALLPGVFGSYSLSLNRRWFTWTLFRSDDTTIAAINSKGVLKFKGGEGSVTANVVIGWPFRLRVPHNIAFSVVREPIDSIIITPARDTLMLGDTAVFEVSVRGVSGRDEWRGTEPKTDPAHIIFDGHTTSVGEKHYFKGLAYCLGRGTIELYIGHHRTLVPILVVDRPGADPARDIVNRGVRISQKDREMMCTWREDARALDARHIR